MKRFSSFLIGLWFCSRFASADFLQRKELVEEQWLRFRFIFSNFAPDSDFCAAGVVDGYGEAAGLSIPARGQAIWVSKQR